MQVLYGVGSELKPHGDLASLLAESSKAISRIWSMVGGGGSD